MLYIVGFGPGGYETMTVEAVRALEDSDLIVGYTTYVDLIRPWFPEKEFLATAMKQEKERCLLAIQKEEDGRKVALVCSGDSGIYGMASLVYELAARDEALMKRIRVIPGVTAAASGGALLGAPLSHDFLTVRFFLFIAVNFFLTHGSTSPLISKKCSAALSNMLKIILHFQQKGKRKVIMQ